MSRHWLLELIERDALPGAEDLDFGEGASTAEVWAAIVGRCNVSDEALVRRVAGFFKLPVADLGEAVSDPARILPEHLLRRYEVFPASLGDDGQVVLATSNPSDLECESALSFALGAPPRFAIASPREIRKAIDACFAPEQEVETLMNSLQATSREDIEQQLVLERGQQGVYQLIEVENAPVVTLTNLIFRSALLDRASDIHIEPQRDHAVVRFRIDGVLHYRTQMPLDVHNGVVARIKVLGRMDIADHLRPQDGRARIRHGGHDYDLRISTVPTRDTEKVVIRLLDPSGSQLLDDLGGTAIEIARFRELLRTRDGIVPVTGPTGSGKTTTLYAALRELTTGEENIMTVEDPIEYELPGVTQMQVEPKQGVRFDSSIRHILRQDPDIIFVGEIRDRETAQVAAQASMTGHLVLTTLHTNDAVGAIPRLADLGLTRHLIAETLRGAVAQRLVRRLCPDCASNEVPLGEQEARLAERFGVDPPYRVVGCRWCERTGYRGRIPILEVLLRTPTFQDLLGGGATAMALQEQAIADGMRPLAQVALERVREGETTLAEIQRVVGSMPPAERTALSQAVFLAPAPRAPGRDAITGLPDPIDFKERFADLIARKGETAPIALVVVDVDNLEQINKRHGRPARDEVLHRIGEELWSRVPDHAGCTRWKSGEFVILLPNRDLARARLQMVHVLGELSGMPLLAQDASARLVLSAGVVEIEGTPTVHEAISAADRYLHRAQEAGGGKVLAGRPMESLVLGLKTGQPDAVDLGPSG